LNSVTQCNTFSYYIDGSARDGDAGQLCGDGYHFIAGDSSTDSQCVQCLAGTYSTGGDTCQACPVGQQAQNSNNNNVYSSGGASYCVACKDGFDNQNGGACDGCPIGQNSTGGEECTACPKGTQAQLNNNDNVFNTGTGSPYCVTCEAGKDNENGDECDACADGLVSVNGAKCGTCPVGTQSQASNTGDVYNYAGALYCVTCADGYDNQDGNACEACPIGEYSVGGANCSVCTDGKQAQTSDSDNVFVSSAAT